MRRTVGIAVGVVGAVAIAAFAVSCGSSTAPVAKTYVANLNAAAEGAGHTSPGSGVVTFVDNGTVIDWTLTLTNMTNVTASHIHLGPAVPGVNTGPSHHQSVPAQPPAGDRNAQRGRGAGDNHEREQLQRVARFSEGVVQQRQRLRERAHERRIRAERSATRSTPATRVGSAVARR